MKELGETHHPGGRNERGFKITHTDLPSNIPIGLEGQRKLFEVSATIEKDLSVVKAETSDKKSYRQQGELEKKYNIEPLPPTPITPNAKKRLKDWGVSDEQIEGLQELTSSFRYDFVPQRAKEIAERGGYIYKDSDNTETVVLPDFFNYKDTFNGQCGDNSIQLVRQVHGSGYLDAINQSIQKKGNEQVQVTINEGISKTHFIDPDNQNHIWVSLSLEKDNGKDMIVIDPSFQNIVTADESEYKIRNINDLKTIKNRETSIEIPIGSYNYDPVTNGCGWNKVESTTLGISSDKKYIYSLGFTKNESTSQIDPTVVAIPPQGDWVYCTGSKDREFWTYGEAYDNLSDTHKEEIVTIVNAFRNISLERNQAKAEEARNKKTTIDFEN